MGRVLSRAWGENSRLCSGLGLATAVVLGLLLIRLPAVEAVVLLGLVALGAGTLAQPLVGVVGGLFLGLLRAYLQTEVPQVPAQIGHLFVALAVAGWVASGMARRSLRIPRLLGRDTPTPLLLPLVGFVGAAWLSIWTATDLAAYGLPEFVKWIEVLLVFLVVVDRAQPRHLPWLLGAILLVGVFQAGVGLYQFALRGEGPEHFLIPDTDFYRAYGTFEQPNPYAGYLGLTLPLALGLLAGRMTSWGEEPRQVDAEWTAKRPRLLTPHLLIYSLLGLIILAALGASWSRGAWIGFGAALATVVVALPRRTRWGLLVVGLLVVFTLALYAGGLLPSAVVTRLTDFAASLRLQDVRGVGINDANYAVIERLAHWQAALGMWRDHFWTGVGLGCYEPAYSSFALVNWPIALGHAHNLYLNLLAETGLVGLLAYVALWGAVLWQTWQLTRHTTGLTRGFAVGLLGTWMHLTVHHLFVKLYVNNVHLLVGLLLGLLSVLLSQMRGSRPLSHLLVR